jgi:hypothetical protein
MSARHRHVAAALITLAAVALLWRGVEITLARQAVLHAEAGALTARLARLAAEHDALLARLRQPPTPGAQAIVATPGEALGGQAHDSEALGGLLVQLRKVPGLALLELAYAPGAAATDATAPARIELVTEGGFFALLAGLDALEALPTGLRAERLDISVDDGAAPRMRLVLAGRGHGEDGTDG